MQLVGIVIVKLLIWMFKLVCYWWHDTLASAKCWVWIASKHCVFLFVRNNFKVCFWWWVDNVELTYVSKRFTHGGLEGCAFLVAGETQRWWVLLIVVSLIIIGFGLITWDMTYFVYPLEQIIFLGLLLECFEGDFDRNIVFCKVNHHCQLQLEPIGPNPHILLINALDFIVFQ
jgi:hypothetical protein